MIASDPNLLQSLTMVCDGVQLNSEICALKAWRKKYSWPYNTEHISGVERGFPQFIDFFKTFSIGKAFVDSKRCAMLAFFNV